MERISIARKTQARGIRNFKNHVSGVDVREGRHLGMMPHPERCFLTWQWLYIL
ncbi:MAG TPA: hypothetical protein DCY49_03730 [Candidatus Jacksonbacteria bacterium]|nr:hypothetical protein [Candidatus Jacksonbacteria bacterium]